MTRKKLAGVVLALALAGALSAGVAAGVERARGRVRKRPSPPPPPLAQQDRARVSPRVHAHVAPAPRPERRQDMEAQAPGVPVARALPAAAVSRPAQGTKGVRTRPAPLVLSTGGENEAEQDARAHAHGASVAGLTSRIPAPMRVGWTVVESVAGRVRLVAEVERRMGFGAPVVVSLSLPPDATLLEGPAEFTVSEGPGGDVRAVPYVVAFGAGGPPLEDLVLVAHAEGRSFGAHAEARHAFGRVAPDAPRPVPAGPALPASLMSGTEPAGGEEQP